MACDAVTTPIQFPDGPILDFRTENEVFFFRKKGRWSEKRNRHGLFRVKPKIGLGNNVQASVYLPSTAQDQKGDHVIKPGPQGSSCHDDAWAKLCGFTPGTAIVGTLELAIYLQTVGDDKGYGSWTN
ncbi:hypothetical protein TNIN_254341 [Trichonephila inaurata madagascariensis]|uniref:Uncharacterized protein n=1 Tax=Trichonephila inaurata madagascariensis TaxID=2747483 RepID=A0A8X6YTY0_9ARAC|nr:hypothetical protein TNIN_254341 [Trichonephila inaurata madagascariensis]